MSKKMLALFLLCIITGCADYGSKTELTPLEAQAWPLTPNASIITRIVLQYINLALIWCAIFIIWNKSGKNSN